MSEDHAAVSLFHKRRGDDFYQQAIFEQAISEYRKSIEANAKDPDLYVRLARAYERKGAQENARAFLLLAADNFRKAISLDPAYADAHDGLVGLGLKLGALDDLVAEYKRKSVMDSENQVIKEALRKLQAISMMTIPEASSQGTEKGCMTRLMLDFVFPLTSIFLMWAGFLVYRYVPNFRFHALSLPVAWFGAIGLTSFILYKRMTAVKLKKSTQW
jgi:tetratricopeptide (TPR) repeat protein